jgi:hypothetical protein
MTGWPTLPEVRQWLRLSANADDDAIIASALAAAIDYGNRRTARQWDPNTDPSTWVTYMPDMVHEACLMHAGRIYKRRDSIDGALGWGDSGIIRIGRADPDITAMYDSVGPLVFG